MSKKIILHKCLVGEPNIVISFLFCKTGEYHDMEFQFKPEKLEFIQHTNPFDLSRYFTKLTGKEVSVQGYKLV